MPLIFWRVLKQKNFRSLSLLFWPGVAGWLLGTSAWSFVSRSRFVYLLSSIYAGGQENLSFMTYSPTLIDSLAGAFQMQKKSKNYHTKRSWAKCENYGDARHPSLAAHYTVRRLTDVRWTSKRFNFLMVVRACNNNGARCFKWKDPPGAQFTERLLTSNWIQIHGGI